jgi:hypothetical protein
MSPTLDEGVAVSDERQDLAQVLWKRIVASFPDDERNEVGPFATGVD